MSRQKYLSYLKCSNLEAKKVMHFKLGRQRDKRSNYNLLETPINKSSKHSSLDTFNASENQN